MNEPSTIHNTFVIERNYPTTPERVYAALADASKKRRWFAQSESQDVVEYEMEFRIGGAERVRSKMSERTPFPGVVLASDGVILDIVENRRVVTAATMTLGERRISSALVTFELLPAESGTDLVFTHQAAFFEGADGPQMREAGWRALLDRLGEALSR